MTEEPAVHELLADEDAEARRRGAQRLSTIQGPEAVALLVRALGDADWRVRKEAAAVAPKVAPRPLVREALFGALGEKDNIGLRNSAVEALILIGSDAVVVATRALAELDADGRKLAVEVLGGVPNLEGTNALTRALNDEDVNVRAAAAEALGSASLAGAEAQQIAIAALTDALVADEPLRRLGALRSLTTLEAKLSFKTFEPLTRDPLLRRYAIAAVGRTHEATAVAALARAVADPSIAVARDALVALVDCLATHFGTEELGRIARREIRSSRAAEDRIRKFAVSVDDGEVRGAALVTLGLLRVRSDVPELVRGLSDDEVAQQAELGLRWFGHDAVAALLEEGRYSAPAVRAATLSLVPLLTESADQATLEILRDALGADPAEVKTAALHAISAAGGGDDLAFVAAHAVSPDPRVAMTACAALTSLASRYPTFARAMASTIPADSPVAVVGCLLRGACAEGGASPSQPRQAADPGDIPFLRSALDHDDVRVRRTAVDALKAIGGSLAAEVVVRALADEERDVVLAAVRALGRMGQAEPLLALLDGGHDNAVLASALRALGEASPARAFDAAWSRLRNGDPLLASAAVETIGQLRGARRDEGLFLALDHPDPGVVKSALVELSRQTSPEILKHIGHCLEHASYDVRRFAAEHLAEAPDPTTRALLRSRLDRETDPVVREALTLALSRRAPPDNDGAP